MEQSDVSMVFNNEEFGHWAVTVERPLRLRVYLERKIPELALMHDGKTLMVQERANWSKKIGRNELCPCGSGKKYKRCHGR